MTYQQMEAIRLRALVLGLVAEWNGHREESEAWLRVSLGNSEISMCWFPSRPPILGVDAEDPADLLYSAVELVGLYATLTARLDS